MLKSKKFDFTILKKSFFLFSLENQFLKICSRLAPMKTNRFLFQWTFLTFYWSMFVHLQSCSVSDYFLYICSLSSRKPAPYLYAESVPDYSDPHAAAPSFNFVPLEENQELLDV